MVGLPQHLGPRYDIQGNPCGCLVITVPNRGVWAIPCEGHMGKMRVSMEPVSPDIDPAPTDCWKKDRREGISWQAQVTKKKDQPIAGTGPEGEQFDYRGDRG